MSADRDFSSFKENPLQADFFMFQKEFIFPSRFLQIHEVCLIYGWRLKLKKHLTPVFPLFLQCLLSLLKFSILICTINTAFTMTKGPCVAYNTFEDHVGQYIAPKNNLAFPFSFSFHYHEAEFHNFLPFLSFFWPF